MKKAVITLVLAMTTTLALLGCASVAPTPNDARHEAISPELSATDVAFEQGTAAFEAKDFSGAYEIWLPLAEGGLSKAQNAIAYLCATGLGRPQSDADAFDWFSKAAQLGNADAQNNLGYLFAKGRGTKMSREQAIKWYLEAAKRGHRTAQQNLYALNNEGLERKVQAPAGAEMVQLKADNGEALYQFLVGMSYLAGNGMHEIDEYAALNWIKKAADQGYPAAEFQLGQFYSQGRVVAQDRDLAQFWISRAADNKYVPAIAWMRSAKAQRASLSPVQPPLSRP